MPLSAQHRYSREDWLKRVEGVLKGRAFETLVSETDDGIRIDPLYMPAAGPYAARPKAAPWTIVQRIDHPDAAKANAQALADLENGASGLVLCIRGAAAARGFGLLTDARSLAFALKDIRIDAIALRLEGNANAARMLADAIAAMPVDPARLDVDFGLDPLADLSSAAVLAERGFRGPFVNADGRRWHDEGASEAEELAFALASGVAALRTLDRLDDKLLTRAVSVTLAAGQDMFLTMAKFRAMRLLWARILDVSKLPATPLALHGETSWRMMTARDPHMNILRSLAGVFGAGLGGADSIAVLPFSLAQGLPDAFARRVARNTQNILLDESNLWRVADPAQGSGYVEHLTHEMCERAWSIFQQVEKAGGMAKALDAGRVQIRIEKSRAARKARIEQGAETIIGVTAFTAPESHKAATEKDIEREFIVPRLADAFEGHAL